jgi:hypothetical protein
MGVCEVCGSEYDKTMDVIVAGEAHVFDSFECAMHAVAPRCARCGCRIVGHGVEAGDAFFCGAHCAHVAGVTGMRDRA